MDCNELASIVSKYSCSRLPDTFWPYQRSQVVVELNGVNGNNSLDIITGDINAAYESGRSGFSIKNSDALLDEIMNIMPYLTDEVRGLEEKNVITFSDGESADLWRSVYGGSNNIYKISDGTTLLTIHDTIGPENVYVGGIESFYDLSEPVQKAVSTYYEEQGLLYDTQSELEKAYVEFLSCKDSGTEYHNRYISQDIAPTASNENIMCFLTSVTGQTSLEIRLGTVFDRETGEVLSNWDLFAFPETDIRQWILNAFNVAEPLHSEMEVALKPEYIILFPDNMEVTFPQGTLPSQEYSYGTGFDYDELRTLLQPWAIPNKR